MAASDLKNYVLVSVEIEKSRELFDVEEKALAQLKEVIKDTYITMKKSQGFTLHNVQRTVEGRFLSDKKKLVLESGEEYVVTEFSEKSFLFEMPMAPDLGAMRLQFELRSEEDSRLQEIKAGILQAKNDEKKQIERVRKQFFEERDPLQGLVPFWLEKQWEAYLPFGYRASRLQPRDLNMSVVSHFAEVMSVADGSRSSVQFAVPSEEMDSPSLFVVPLKEGFSWQEFSANLARLQKEVYVSSEEVILARTFMGYTSFFPSTHQNRDYLFLLTNPDLEKISRTYQTLKKSLSPGWQAPGLKSVYQAQNLQKNYFALEGFELEKISSEVRSWVRERTSQQQEMVSSVISLSSSKVKLEERLQEALYGLTMHFRKGTKEDHLSEMKSKVKEAELALVFQEGSFYLFQNSESHELHAFYFKELENDRLLVLQPNVVNGRTEEHFEPLIFFALVNQLQL